VATNDVSGDLQFEEEPAGKTSFWRHTPGDLTQFIIDRTRQSILWVDITGKILYVNNTVRHTLGYSHREISHKNIFDITPTLTSKTWKMHWKMLRQKGSFSFESYHLRKDGSLVPVEVTANYLKHRGKEYNCVFALDISDRKQTDALIKSLVKSMVGVTGQECFDKIVAELCAHFNAECAIVGQISDKETVRILSMQIDGNKITKFEYPLRGTPSEQILKKGQNIYLHSVSSLFPADKELAKFKGEGYIGSPIIDRKGHLIGVICVISKRRIKVKDHWRDILNIIAARSAAEIERITNDEERKALDELVQNSQKLESLGLLAGGIAHDFNNIILAILGNANLARKNIDSPSAVNKYINEIESASILAAKLCKKMLVYSGAEILNIELINISDIVVEIANLLKTSITKKINIELNTDNNVPLINADAGQIRQVILNLITNASEAIGDCEGVIAISTGYLEHYIPDLMNGYIEELADEEGYCFIKVSDTGSGIDSYTAKKIFEPFFTTKGMGRGLGMASVLGIIRGHKGAIKFDSDVVAGTTFTVILPVQKIKTDAHTEVTTHKTEDTWRGAGAVLLVDPDRLIRKINNKMLKSIGYDVLTASDNQEIKTILKDKTLGVVCCLIDMAFLRTLDKKKIHDIYKICENIPILISSSCNNQEFVDDLNIKGSVEIIQKPFSLSTLTAKIRDTLKKAQKD